MLRDRNKCTIYKERLLHMSLSFYLFYLYSVGLTQALTIECEAHKANVSMARANALSWLMLLNSNEWCYQQTVFLIHLSSLRSSLYISL